MNKRQRSCALRRAAPAAALGLAVLAGTTLGWAGNQTATNTAETGQTTRQMQFANELSHAFRDAAKTIAPSVVSILAIEKPAASSSHTDNGQALRDPFADEFFRRFFGDRAPQFGRVIPLPQQERRAQGTGVIFSADGYIVTNNHVVKGSNEFRVTLNDGREYDAKVIGTDPDTDLAVVKIDATGLTPATFGDSNKIEPGDWVVAVGCPFGLDHTVTAGIVSAKGRGGMGLSTYEDYIQTDAAINPGNSGGPLIDLKGEVVGINSAIKTASGGSNGIGFAIPSSTVRMVMDSILAKGHVDRGWLGVTIQPLTPDLASTFGFGSRHGALISNVLDSTPAAKAGLKSGDIIVELNHKKIDGPQTLMNQIGAMEPGKSVSVKVFRDGDYKTFTLTLGQRPDVDQITGKTPAAPKSDLGISVEPMTPDLAQQLGVNAGAGVVVGSVDPGSPADEAGISAGDVVLDVDGTPIRNTDDWSKAIKNADPARGVRLKVSTHGRMRFVVIKTSGG